MKTKLPSWATFLPKSTPDQTSMKDEEFELRLRSFHFAKKRLDQVYHASLYKHVSAILGGSAATNVDSSDISSLDIYNTISNFLHRFSPGKKRKRIHLRSTTCSGDLGVQEETLLPLAILNLSISPQDRTQIVSMMRQHFIQRHHSQDCAVANYRPAVCIIKDYSRSNKVKSRTSHHLYLREILIQCLQQEEESFAWMYLLDHSYRSSYQDRILEWAGSTTSRNAILVIFENPETIPNETMGALMTIFIDFRSSKGVPISLIMCSSYQGLVEQKISSLSSFAVAGRTGMVIEKFELIKNTCIYDDFISTLCLESNKSYFPIQFSGDILNSMREDYHYHHTSVAQMHRQCKTALAHHFCIRGSFLSMSNDDEFSSIYGANIAWFCTDSIAKAFITGSLYNMKCSQELLQALLSTECFAYLKRVLFQLLLMIKTAQFDSVHRSVMFEGYLTKSLQFSRFLDALYFEIRNMPKDRLLFILAKWLQETKYSIRKFLTHRVSSFFSDISTSESQYSQSSKFEQFLERSLVLLKSLEQKDINWDFREEFVSELHTFVWEPGFNSSDPLSHLFFYDYRGPNNHFGSLTSPNLRNDLVVSIYNSSGVISDVKAASHILDTRVISTDEWFQKFIEEVANGEVVEDLLPRFALAVYQLLFCGFVIRSRRRENTFEKAALAWATMQ